MRNMQTFIDYLVRSHERQRRNIIFTTTLSVLVMIFVSLILTKSADSTTGNLVCGYEAHTHTESCYVLDCKYETSEASDEMSEASETSESDELSEQTTMHEHTDECFRLVCTLPEHVHSQDCYESEAEYEEIPTENNSDFLSAIYNNKIQVAADEDTSSSEPEYFTSSVDQLPDGAFNVYNNIVANPGNNPTGVENEGYENNGVKDVTFRIAFNFNSVNGLNDLQNYPSDKPLYLYYPLPEGVSFAEEKWGKGLQVKDDDKLAAYYSFSKADDGKEYIVLRVVDEYRKNILAGASDFNCSILFDSYVSRDNSTNDGDRTVTLGPDISSKIEFNDIKPSIRKDAGFNENNGGEFNNGKPYAEWTIEIKNPAPATNLIGYQLTDNMLASAIEGSIKITPEDCIDQSNWTIIKEPDNKGDPIKIVYRTEVDVNAVLQTDTKRIDNTAKISKDGDEYSDDASVTLSAATTISKGVTEDYKAVPGSIANKLVWNLDVQTKYGSTLSGLSVADAAFADSNTTDIIVSDGTNNLVLGTDYTIADGKIKFADSVTANSVKITYKTNVINGQENIAEVRDKGDNILASDPETYWGTYEPFLNYEKKAEYDSKTNLVKWTIVFKPNGEHPYPDLSINGFTLKDEAFLRIADANGDGVVDKNDLEIKGYENQYSSTTNIDWELNGNTISFSTDDSVTGQYGKSKAIGAEITFYVPPTDKEQESLDAGNVTKFENTATLKNQTDSNNFSKDITGEYEYTSKNNISKTKITNKDVIFGTKDDQKTAPIDWEITMEQDMGFSGGTKALVDVMEVVDYNNNVHPQADHYISPAQQGNIKVYVKNKLVDWDKSWTWGDDPIDPSMYEIRFFSDKEGQNEISNAQNARSFTIIFNSAIDDDNYKEVKINYQTTADVTNVTDSARLKFKNQTVFNDKTAEGNPFEAEVWDENSKHFTKIAIDNTAKDITGQKVNLNKVTTATYNGTKYYIFGWDIKFTATDYDSKITLSDKLPDGFTLCTPDDLSAYRPKAKYANGNFYDLQYYPYYHDYDCAYAKDTNTAYFTINQNGFEVIRYYTKIPAETFEAMLSEGAGSYKVSNSIVDKNEIFDPETAEITVSGEAAKDPITKNYIPHESFGEVENTASNDKGDNFIEYSIDINPDSADLSKTDELILKDAFSTISYQKSGEWNSTLGMSLADAILTELKIYKVNADGSKGDELSTSDYTYQYYAQTPSREEITPNITKDKPDEWTFEGLSHGDEVTLKYKSDTPNMVISTTDDTFMLQFIGMYGNTLSEIKLNDSSDVVFDENGYYIYTCTIPDGCKGINTYNMATFGGKKIPSCEISASRRTSLSELDLVIPDETHLRLEYRYRLLKNGVRPDGGATLKFKNQATLIGKDTFTDNVDDTQLTFTYDSAQASATTYPKIRKLDVGDYSIVGLNAQFKLAVYDDTQWRWCNQSLQTNISIPTPIDIVSWTTDENNAALIQTINGEFKLNGLPTGKLLALVEVEKPEHSEHIYEDVSKLKPFYFVYSSSPETLPSVGVKGEAISSNNVKTINQGNEISITNNRLIDITVNKTWSEQLENPSITAELYWSYTKALTGFPKNMNKVLAEDFNLDSFDNPVTFDKTYTWQNLPNGKNGRPIYYYVVETAYSVDGTQYTLDNTDELYKNGDVIGKYLPVYTGNAVNQEDQPITILNASSLQIEKQWLDKNNRPLPPNYWSETVEFKLYGQITQDAEEELIMNGSSETFTITADDDWICKLEPALINKYNFFRVEEVNVPVGFNVTYKENYQGHTGKITITNKNPVDPEVPITIAKKWIDDGSASRPTPTFKVLRSVDNSTWTYVEDITQPTPIKNENLWTFTFEHLPYRDENGNIYNYKIEEDPLDGYVLTKQENNDGIPYGIITFTNTKALKIDAEKIWHESYNSKHEADTITLKLYSSRNAADVNVKTSLTPIQIVTISASDNWKYTFENLPMYEYEENDGKDKDLYYWIVEDEISGYETSYIYDETVGNKYIVKADGKVVVNNDFIYPEVILPSTGGVGTKLYYIIGTALILTSGIVYIISKKRILKNKK